MAAYFIDGCHLDDTPEEFVHSLRIGVPNILGYIKDRQPSHVLTLQVDGDELNAVLWGLAKFDKAKHTPELREMFELARLYAMAQREFYPDKKRG